MIDRRFFVVFFMSCSLVLSIGFLYIQLFYQPQAEQAITYQDLDLIIPVQEFLKRGANSNNLSTVKRLLVNQWIYFNQDDLIKLVIYAQGATSFDELCKAFENAFLKEPKNNAIGFVKGSLEKIKNSPELIKHTNKSLQEGLNQQIHDLRGKLMQADRDSREYKKIKAEYQKALYQWIDQKHGTLLDDLILQV
ncbi:hypothetical protein KAZ82_02205 [Candidatus Babeliales bacterium]|nr:hypothetical protein [Candidatus Babeliales bacterium]